MTRQNLKRMRDVALERYRICIGLSTFYPYRISRPTMEETPILSTGQASHCEFDSARMLKKTIPLTLFTHLLYKSKKYLYCISLQSSTKDFCQSIILFFNRHPIIDLLPSNIFMRALFFSCFFISFSSYTFFMGLQELA